MVQLLLKYGICFWLFAFLSLGISPLSSKAYAQLGYPDKVLQTKKKKKEKKKTQLKKSRKARGTSGKDVIEVDSEQLMELRKPGEWGKKKLPKQDKHAQPELNGNKTHTIKYSKTKGLKKIFQGRQKIKKKDIIPPGTPPEERNKRVARNKRNQQGTNYGGPVEVPKSEVVEPGKGLKRSRRDLKEIPKEKGTAHSGQIRQKTGTVAKPGVYHDERPQSLLEKHRNKGAEGVFSGKQKIKKNEILEPGTHHDERSNSLKNKYRNKATEGSYAGKQKIKKNEILEPGTRHDERSNSLKNKYRNKATEGSFAGHQKIRKNEIIEPGTPHDERKESVGRQYSSYEGGRHAGKLKVAKKDLRKPGTHHLDRKMSQADQYESTAAANHPGSLRVKKKYLKEPGTYHSERKASLAKQYSSYKATSFEGNIRGLSKKEKARYYEKQSENVHQFEGSLKVKVNQRNMHPSVAARKTAGMRSKEQVERSRNFNRWWNRLWKKDQPDSATDKPLKPHYDREESEIWQNSREW